MVGGSLSEGRAILGSLLHSIPLISIFSEPHYPKRRVLEIIWIKKTSRNSNLDCGLVLNQTWFPYFDCHLAFWHSPHFNFLIPFINHSHSVNHLLRIPSYIINPCLYQPISVLFVHLLLIQLTKVYRPKRPALLLPIYAILS